MSYISFEDVCKDYPAGNTVVHASDHVNFQIEKGEFCVVLGPSGAGKTTLCNLIPRFYDVTGGCIRIDGQDIRTLTQKSLREAIGMVQQEVYLFAGSVLELSLIHISEPTRH
mgnify:CR=1 FL=1